MNNIYGKYCPVCSRVISPENIDEYESGIDDGLLYIHDDVPHEDDDIDAYEKGIN